MSKWLSSLPEWFPSVQKDEQFIVKFCSDAFQEKWTSVQHEMGVLLGKGIEGVIPLSRAIAHASSARAWYDHPEVQNRLTFPESDQGLQSALSWTLQNADQENMQESLFVLSALFPKSLRLAIVDTQNINGEWSHVAWPLDQLSQEKSSQEKSTQPQNSLKKSNEKRGMSKYVTRLSFQMKEMLAQVPEQSPLPVQREAWNGILKKHIISEKGVSPDAINYWFEDVFLPAVCGMDTDCMKRILDIQSKHLRPSLHNPSFALPRLFTHMKGMPRKERLFFLEEVLPKLIDSSEWNFRDRFTLFQSLVAGTEEKAWSFKERFSLWERLGGSLDEEGVLKSSGSVFSELSSARQLVRDSGHEVWLQVLREKEEEVLSSRSSSPRP